MLARGDYRNQTEKVQPGVPAMLPPLPKDAPPNRLTLAKWLVDPAHPLTARVAVNRFWQMYFGYGIVKTQEDFGVQGEPPVHPELLDWLATEFIRTGWDIRAMQRLIVTSATYRQSSSVTPALLEKDPENRLLARGPRVPAAGRDDPRHRARGERPAQRRDRRTERASRISRRGCGRRWRSARASPRRRTSRATARISTGAACTRSGSAPCRRRRSRRSTRPTARSARRAATLTNTPLQALALLNDPTYVEAARALAQRALLEGGKDDDGRHRVRLPPRHRAQADRQGSRRAARRCSSEQLASFRRDRPAAVKLLSVGESPRDAAARRRGAGRVDDGGERDSESR